MGSVFKPKVPAVPTPPPPSIYRDEVGGTEQVPIQNADGSTTYVTRRLPLTPDQQREQDEYKNIMSTALVEIRRLSATDFADDPTVNQALEQFKSAQSRALSQSLQQRTESEEQSLARRGVLDSTAAQTVRRQRAADERDARQQIVQATDVVKEDIRNDRLGLQQNLYSLAANRQDLDQVKAQQSASSGLNATLGINNANRASLMDYYSRQANSFGLTAGVQQNNPFSVFSGFRGVNPTGIVQSGLKFATSLFR
jgi:hypothetical protein